MAQNGLSLSNVHGVRYEFKPVTPQECFYFVMTPEAGTNSDVWVFYEFEKELGKRISCSGTSFFSPSHILLVTHEVLESQSDVITYYFQYRNYRLLKRFRKNTIFSSIFFFIGVLICSLRFPVYAIALFPYLLVSGLFLIHFLISYFSFHKNCVQQGFTKPARKPHRPGY